MNMARPIRDDEEEKPLDPAVEAVRQRLVRFMLINLAILGVALIAVVGAIVYKVRSRPETPPAVPALAAPSDGGLIDATITLPAGSRIVSQSLSGERVSLYVEGQGGARSLYIYDTATGRMVARLAIQDGN
jgi:hypothetical protein